MPESIGGILPTTPAQMQSSVDSAMSALGGMDSEGFLKLLVAQLQYQSPLDPKDPGDLMTQTAALAQLDASQQLLAIQQRDLGMQQAVGAAGMLGSEVLAFDQDGAVRGIVDAVRYTDAGPVIAIGDREVRFEDVRELRRAGAVAPAEAASVTAPQTTTPSTAAATSVSTSSATSVSTPETTAITTDA